MARKSERLSSSAKALPVHKRTGSASLIPSTEAKRSKKATPTKSQYFANDGGRSDLPDASASEIDPEEEEVVIVVVSTVMLVVEKIEERDSYDS